MSAPQKLTKPWIKLDQDMPWNEHIIQLSDGAFRLYITCLCWCAKNEKDGMIPRPVAHRLGPRAKAKELVKQGRFIERDGDLYEIKGYLDWQLSSGKVELYREARKSDGMKGAHIRHHVIPNQPKAGCELCIADGVVDA